MNLKFQITDFKLMKKPSLVLLSILFFCKISVAQKINLPDSLPFTLEYIDSTTFVNAKSLNAELIRDTSDFRWRHDTLILFGKSKLIRFFVNDNYFGNPQFDTSKPDVGIDVGETFEPIGYYRIHNKKWYLIKINKWESTNNLLFDPTENNDLTLSDFAVNFVNCKIISTFFTPVGLFESEFYLSTLKDYHKGYSFSFNCEDKFAMNDCLECICQWIQERKWISDKTIFLQSVRFTTNKKYYLKLTLKK
jgi:hypothetical protein